MFLEVYPIVLGVSNLKYCRYCNQYLPLDAFHSHPTTPDRRSNKCKSCVSAYQKARREANPELEREKCRAYAQSERGKANRARYDAENAEAIAATKREWRAANPEKVKEHRRESQKRNRASANERLKRWQARNPEKRLAEVHKRRARLAGAGGSYTAADIDAIRIAQTDKRGRVRCWICGKPMPANDQTIDHFIPLARGGSNDASNLHLVHSKCNSSKNAKHPFELGRLL